jgi:beta-glucosidase
MTGRTYRYITEDPLYPFGYGLSYTDFKYSDGKFDPNTRTFTFRIENVGERDGEEVAQLYLTNKGDAKGPLKTLVGFERVGIPAGQSVWVTFNIDDDFFKMFSEREQQFEHSSGPFVFQYADKVLEVKF